jgi:uncharacterized repeat protein (TIGR03803 family)
MSRIRSLGTLAAVLLVIVLLVLAPGTLAQSTYKTLHRFYGADGQSPTAGLIFDAAGSLYGTTASGGTYDGGTVFKLTPNSDGKWSESVLYNFCSLGNCDDGRVADTGLIFDQVGNLYGMTSVGGSANGGTVFKLTSKLDGSWSESVLYNFPGGGVEPGNRLIFDKAGSLYGTTGFGGVHNSGTVFKLTPDSDGKWSESVLYSFCSITNCDDGRLPYAGLILDQAGNLYGTTVEGGRDGEAGTVFRLTPKRDGTWTESVLYRFCSRSNCSDGFGPYADLIFDQAGNLYGTTWEGGLNGAGTVFKLTPNGHVGWTGSVLHNFCSRTNCSDGSTTFASLTFDGAGNLYGATYYGGNPPAAGYGVVFKLTPSSNGGWKETVLHSFFDHPGAHPLAGLIFDLAGNLYGTTSGDQRTTYGSVFEITP